MKAEEIKYISLIGAGMIGHGLALHFAKAGFQVAICDKNQQILDKAIQNIKSSLSILLDKAGENTNISDVLNKIQIHTNIRKSVENSQFVIESVTEDLKIKQEIFKELDSICPIETILATNTSVLRVSDIARKSKYRERIIGTHFWNPPYLLPLVEVVKGEKTSDETVEQTYRFMQIAGKFPIKCLKDVPGFVANRLQHALWREAISIVEHGIADAKTVDDAVKNSFGIRLAVLGPIENADMAGLDLTLAIHNTVLRDLEASHNPSKLLKEKVKKGELGFKSGKGFYDSWTSENIKLVREKMLQYLIDYSKKYLNKY